MAHCWKHDWIAYVCKMLDTSLIRPGKFQSNSVGRKHERIIYRDMDVHGYSKVETLPYFASFAQLQVKARVTLSCFKSTQPRFEQKASLWLA